MATKPITAQEILAAIKSPVAPNNEDTFGDKFVGWTADKVDSAGVALARLTGAVQASGENFNSHRKLELGVDVQEMTPKEITIHNPMKNGCEETKDGDSHVPHPRPAV
jgi:hypothetical protein